MAGRREVAHGTDKASRIQKFDGLPENGKCIDDGYPKQRAPVPVLGNFVSTLGNGVEYNPVLSASQFGDNVAKPKFVAKITITDSNGDGEF